MNDKIVLFLKFGSEKNIIGLYENGTIYMNPINNFRIIEDQQVRGDSYEGLHMIRNIPKGQFEIKSIGYKGNYLGINMRETYEKILGNIYSLYCISSHGFKTPEDVIIDNKVKEFGSHFLLIKDVNLFFNLLTEKLTSLKMKFHHGFVRYYDRYSINGEITLFMKPNEFEYQKEFRFYVERDEITPFSFKIGNLKNISEVIESSNIHELKLISNTSPI